MRTTGLVTRGRVTLGRGIVIIADTGAYGRAYGSLRPESDGLSESKSQTDYQS